MKEFKRILKMDQETLKNYVYRKISAMYSDVENHGQYVYAKGDIPIMLVAHLDTVHKMAPQQILFDKYSGLMWSPQGIGGDDRCGVFGLLAVARKGLRPHLLFTTDEEIGGRGARAFVLNHQNLDVDLKYMIEMDRRGSQDCVFYDCGNNDFIQYVESFGFTENYGTYSDISTLSPQYDVASVNLSSGYYNEHTSSEYINVNHMFRTINKIIKMLKNEPKAPYFDYKES